MILSKTIYLEVKDFKNIKDIKYCNAINPINKKQYIEKNEENIFVWNNGIMIFNDTFNEQSYSIACGIFKTIFKNE